MKKRILQSLLLLGTVAWFTTPFFVAPSGQEVVNETAIAVQVEEETKEEIVEIKHWFEGWTTSVVNVREEPSEESKILKVYSEYEYLHFYEHDNEWVAIIFMNKLDDSSSTLTTAYIKKDHITTDKVEIEYRQLMDRRTVTKEWYIEYKDFIDSHSDKYDMPETIYDYFYEKELFFLYKVVQAEIGDYSFEQRVNVVNVIFNRLKSQDERSFIFQDTLMKVLRYDQFETIQNGRINNVVVDEETILACEYAFLFEDTTQGALFFDSNGALNYEFIFNDGAHNFYKLKEY